MELQTVKQVSLDYSISNRMLRYYEQIGLIESTRIDNYAYRVYDEANIKRLQQVIFLRKLQIPVKQIKDILNNQNAIEVIEIFKQNINELDEQITALSTVKSILVSFVDELQEKADVHLKLDLLNDKTMLEVVNVLSFSENKIKEKISMEALNKASEALNKIADSDVRIIYLPPMTIACAGCQDHETEKFQSYIDYVDEPYKKGKISMRDVLKKFIGDVDLFKIKPDARIFRFQNYEDQNYEGYWLDVNGIWASIPDDLDVPAPLGKMKFYGGLYAWYKGNVNLGLWLDNNDEYEWAPEYGINKPIMEEVVNPFNRYGLKNTYSEETGFVTDTLFPIRKTKKITDEEREKVDSEMNKIIPRNEPVEIDLMSMIFQKDDDVICELNYPNGLIELKRDDGWHTCRMVSPQQFNYPMKIELRAKKDKCAIAINCAQITFGLNANGNCMLDIDENSSWMGYKNLGKIPTNEFFNFEVILTKEMAAIKVNGELRYVGSNFEYIKRFEENPEYVLSGAVAVSIAGGAMTIESLRVTEL